MESSNGLDVCGTGKEQNLRKSTKRKDNKISSWNMLSTYMKMYRHPFLQTIEKRKSTYKTWPRILDDLTEDLIANGFFYTGFGDKVTCFKCGGLLKDWFPHQNVQRRHEYYYPQCLELFPSE